MGLVGGGTANEAPGGSSIVPIIVGIFWCCHVTYRIGNRRLLIRGLFVLPFPE